MKKYKYSGPPSGADIDSDSFIFHNGKEYDLPEENDYVKTLVVLGNLKEIVEIEKNPPKKEVKNAS